MSAIAGCWASTDRRTVLPVVERYKSVLLYAPAYEGLEHSSHLLSTGGTANQQTIPAVRWFLENRGKKFFLVGSDDIWAHSENEIIRDQLSRLGGEIVGEEYLPLHVHNVGRIIEKIAAAKPDVIVNSLSHAIVGFFHRLRAAGIDPNKVSTFSLAVGEDLLRRLRPDEVAGSYAVWPYFQSLNTPENRTFIVRDGVGALLRKIPVTSPDGRPGSAAHALLGRRLSASTALGLTAWDGWDAPATQPMDWRELKPAAEHGLNVLRARARALPADRLANLFAQLLSAPRDSYTVIGESDPLALTRALGELIGEIPSFASDEPDDSRPGRTGSATGHSGCRTPPS